MPNSNDGLLNQPLFANNQQENHSYDGRSNQSTIYYGPNSNQVKNYLVIQNLLYVLCCGNPD